MYILGTVCLATFGLSLLQQGYELHMPGFLNPATAFLSSVLIKKALLPNGSDIKVKGLSEHYSEVKQLAMRILLTEYLSAVAYIEKWDTKCKIDTPEHKKTAVQLYALIHFNDYHAYKNK